MIEFYGEYSESSKSFLLKQNAILGLVVSSIISLILIIVILLIAIMYEIWIILLFLLPVVVTVILTCLAPYIQKNKALDQIIPEKIEINEEDSYLYVYLKNAVISKELSEIQKVINMKEGYLLKLSCPKLSGFLIQKDLIKQGTLDEFEKLFEGKIVMDKKNKS